MFSNPSRLARVSQNNTANRVRVHKYLASRRLKFRMCHRIPKRERYTEHEQKKPTTFAHWSFLFLCVCVRNENGIRVWYAHRCREHVLPQMWCLMKIWGYGEVMEGAADTACCLRCSGVRMRRLLTRVDCGQSQRRGRQWRSRGGGNAGASPQSREPRNRLDELTYSIRRPLQNSWIYSYKKHEQGPSPDKRHIIRNFYKKEIMYDACFCVLGCRMKNA